MFVNPLIWMAAVLQKGQGSQNKIKAFKSNVG